MFAKSLPRFTALAAFASLAVSAPALAQSASRSVGFDDLNLASAAGRSALDKRLDRSAQLVCNVGYATDLVASAASSRCYRAAITDARDAAEDVIAKHSGARVVVASR